MRRSAEIQEKIAYALERQRSLAAEVNAAAASDAEVPYVGVKVGEILSACRECLDYCIKDLVDRYSPGYAKNVYFPLVANAVNSKPIKDWQVSQPSLYSRLLELTILFDSAEVIPGTIFRYSTVKEVNDIVNDKKHDKITKMKRRSNSSTMVTFEGGLRFIMSPMFNYSNSGPDFGEDVGAQEMIGSNDSVKIKYIDEYRLDINGWEIVRYTLHAVQAVWRILDPIYEEFLDGVGRAFDPEEMLKPQAQKEFEAAIKVLEPIVFRPFIFILYMGEEEVRRIKLEVDGKVNSENADDVELGKELHDAFVLAGWPLMANEFWAYLRADPSRIPKDVNTPRYMEVKLNMGKMVDIVLASGSKLSYNAILTGIGTEFKSGRVEFLNRGRDVKDHARAQMLYGVTVDANFAFATRHLGERNCL